MRKRFSIRCCLILGLSSIACARPQYIAPMQGAPAGPYPTYNCGTHTQDVSVLVNILLSTLQSVLHDLSLPRSSPAYNAFFKGVTFAPEVHDIFSNITAGTPVAPGPHGIKFPPPGAFGIPSTPQFICVTATDQVTWSYERGGRGGAQHDAYTACEQDQVQAFGIFSTKYLENTIILCPSFWTYLAIPPSSPATCPTVDPHFNRFKFRGNRDRMLDYQLWVLLHELVHIYVYARSGSLFDVHSANDCFLLSGSSAVNNALSYVYYAANIRLGCTEFPRSGRSGYSGTSPINNSGVELLEIDANTTLTGGLQSQNVTGEPSGSDSIRTLVDIPNTAP